MPGKTHFGFESVDWDAKEEKVREVFSSVASQYDLMNDLMSLGLHRWWKRFTVHLSQVRPGQKVLDLAGGSGDVTRLLSQKVQEQGQVVLADINSHMLQVGRNRLLDEGFWSNIRYVQANAQNLPFPNHAFDCIVMAFGLRNVTDKGEALRSMYRVCKPGGKVLILEFSHFLCKPLQPLYDWYSFTVLPRLGEFFAQDAKSYQYLAESIRMHPDQEALCLELQKAGFEDVHYHNMSAGIVALHIGYKY